MNEKFKDVLWWGMLATAAGLMISSKVGATQDFAAKIQDHFKTVIKQTPYKVEICSERNISGDKTGDTLLGAIIGGAIGQNITKNLPDGATAGAILGGILGHQNSNSQGGTKTICRYQTRYKEQTIEMYSHSTITFNYNGRTYIARFNK